MGDEAVALSIARGIAAVDMKQVRSEKCSCASCIVATHRPARLVAESLIALASERDALRERVKELEDQLRVSDELRAAQDETVALNVERDTAEQIAAWLEQCIDDFPRRLDGRATIIEAAEHIREGSWRKDKP